jgi:polysaccharide biosynthesis protein PslH
MRKPKLLFVSPQFLLPADTGGKIRSSNILRGLKQGKFDIHLIAPATADQAQYHAAGLAALCHHFDRWEPLQGTANTLRRWSGLLSPLPVTIWADATAAAKTAVRNALALRPDVVVADYTHSAAFVPAQIDAASLLFTHNVEAEIFRRHAQTAAWPKSWLWAFEHAKMQRFEDAAARRFDTVIGVSARDAAYFAGLPGVANAQPIPTGVDLDFFSYQVRPADALPVVVFVGSMDWPANQDGVRWFLDEVWPTVLAQVPAARFRVVGRKPPQALVAAYPNVQFTGYVDDVRPHMADAVASVIPLRVGGGTRIKAYESMASGLALVSTALGVEGLPLTHGANVQMADDPAGFAAALAQLLTDAETRLGQAEAARALVEANFGADAVARVFEQICVEALVRRDPAWRSQLACL